MAENTSQTGGYSAVSQNSVAIEGVPVKAQQSSDSATASRHNVFEDIWQVFQAEAPGFQRMAHKGHALRTSDASRRAQNERVVDGIWR